MENNHSRWRRNAGNGALWKHASCVRNRHICSIFTTCLLGSAMVEPWRAARSIVTLCRGVMGLWMGVPDYPYGFIQEATKRPSCSIGDCSFIPIPDALSKINILPIPKVVRRCANTEAASGAMRTQRLVCRLIRLALLGLELTSLASGCNF